MKVPPSPVPWDISEKLCKERIKGWNVGASPVFANEKKIAVNRPKVLCVTPWVLPGDPLLYKMNTMGKKLGPGKRVEGRFLFLGCCVCYRAPLSHQTPPGILIHLYFVIKIYHLHAWSGFWSFLLQELFVPPPPAFPQNSSERDQSAEIELKPLDK